MIKKLIRLWFTIAMYELGKWIGRELYYKLTANDEVEVPKDFDVNDHAHLNESITWWIVIIPVMYLVWLCVKSKGEHK